MLGKRRIDFGVFEERSIKVYEKELVEHTFGLSVIQLNATAAITMKLTALEVPEEAGPLVV